MDMDSRLVDSSTNTSKQVNPVTRGEAGSGTKLSEIRIEYLSTVDSDKPRTSNKTYNCLEV